MPGGNLADRLDALSAPTTGDGGAVTGNAPDREVDEVIAQREPEPDEPTLPVMPFPTFTNTPTLPAQTPGNGFESGRDSRAR